MNTELSVISVAVKIDIMLWNSLPEIVISADTTDTFKIRLDKFWQHQDILYDYKVELTGVGNRSQINADDNVVRVFTIRSISRLPVVRFAIARLRNHLEIGWCCYVNTVSYHVHVHVHGSAVYSQIR